MAKIIYKEIAPERWADFERLFGDNGACGGCWCQWWRVAKGKKEWEEQKGRKNKAATKKLITTGAMTGLLVYDGDKAVGWCSYGPREIFTRIEQTRAYLRDDTEGVWCINCFFIDRHYRRQGLARGMLTAALKFIKKRKVKIVEAYPMPLTKDGRRLPSAFTYTGPLALFEEMGFEIIQRQSHSRPLVRKTL